MSERHRGRAPLGSEAEGEATKGGREMNYTGVTAINEKVKQESICTNKEFDKK
jgi:hypothetical protein